METHRQGTSLFTAILFLIGTIVIVQLWLLAAAVDALLQHDLGVLTPVAVASLVLLASNALLLRYGLRFDARLRHGAERESR